MGRVYAQVLETACQLVAGGTGGQVYNDVLWTLLKKCWEGFPESHLDYFCSHDDSIGQGPRYALRAHDKTYGKVCEGEYIEKITVQRLWPRTSAGMGPSSGYVSAMMVIMLP